MIIYNVTVNIEDSVHNEWLEWMRNSHIPEVMRTGMFVESKILRLLGDDESGGSTYSFQYICESLEKFKQYEENYAPALRADVNSRYKEKFVSFRSLLEIVE